MNTRALNCTPLAQRRGIGLPCNLVACTFVGASCPFEFVSIASATMTGVVSMIGSDVDLGFFIVRPQLHNTVNN